jgi:tetratricopeptide (TPR) repeat protein
MLPFAKRKQCEEALVLLPAHRAAAATEELRYGDALAVYDEAIARFPDNWVLRNDRAAVLSTMGELKAATEELEALLDHPNIKEPVNAMLKNNIAWNLLIIDPEANLERAEELSRAAIAVHGNVPAVTGTRGSVQVMRGNLDDGIALLKKAIDLATSPNSRAENAAWLALAYALAGDVQPSERYLSLSRQLDSSCVSLRFVEPRIEAALSRD